MLKPIIILCIISTLSSLIFSDTFLSFAKYFLLFCLAQVVFYNIYKTIVEFIAMRLQIEKLKEFSKQGLEIKCPCYMEKKMFVPIDLNGSNVFDCKDCDKSISVDVTARSFLQTDIIDLDKADEKLIKAYRKIQETL